MGCTGWKVRRECQRDQVREVTILIIWVHRHDFLGHGRPKNLENLTNLSLRVFSGKKRAHFDKFGDHASGCPHIDFLVVKGLAKDEFWCSIVTRTDVRDRRVVIVNTLR